MACPTDEDLLYASFTREPAVARHVRGCRRCRDALEELLAVESILASHPEEIFVPGAPSPQGESRPGRGLRVAVVLLLLGTGLAARALVAPVQLASPGSLRGPVGVPTVTGQARELRGSVSFRIPSLSDADRYELRLWSAHGDVPLRFESPHNPVLVSRESVAPLASGGPVLWQIRAWSGRTLVAESLPLELWITEAEGAPER